MLKKVGEFYINPAAVSYLQLYSEDPLWTAINLDGHPYLLVQLSPAEVAAILGFDSPATGSGKFRTVGF